MKPPFIILPFPARRAWFLTQTTLASLGMILLGASTAQGAVAYTTGPVDVADGKPTFGDVAFGFPSSNGNNGNLGDFNHADYPSSATPYPGQGTNAPNPYWEVDLQGTYALDRIVVTDRAGCCDPNRLDGSIVTLFSGMGSVVATETLTGLAGTNGESRTFTNGGVGYDGVARIRVDGVNGGQPIQYFQFAEFDAIATLMLPVNWAAGAAASIHDSTGAARGSWPGLPASNATDGNRSSLTHPENQADHANWYLEVDLGQEIFLDNISLTGRTDGCCPERLRDYQLQFLDANKALSFAYDHTGITQATENIDIIGMSGGLGPRTQFIRVVNTDGTQYGPQVGEIEAFGVMVPEPGISSLLMLGAAAGLLRRRRAQGCNRAAGMHQ